MKKTLNLYLILIFSFSVNIEPHAQEIAQNNSRKTLNPELCGVWTLNKVTYIPEKTIVVYEINKTELMFECENLEFHMIEINDVVLQGTWSLADQNIEFKTAESKIHGTVTSLSKKKLIITLDNEIREYSRK